MARLLSGPQNIKKCNWLPYIKYFIASFRSTAHRSTETSYISRSSPEPLLGQTVGDVLDYSADNFGDRPAVIVSHQNIRKTYEQFRSDVDQLAAGFLAIGFKTGDRIGMWSPNNYEWVITQYAAAKAGLIMVTVNPLYHKDEFIYCINKVDLKGIIFPEEYKPQNYHSILTSIIPFLDDCKPGEVKHESVKSLSHIITIGEKTFKGAFPFEHVRKCGGSREMQTLQELKKTIQFDDPSMIQFTSGTTGRPKGATLTHHNMVNNANHLAKGMGFFDKPHRICISVPLYHCFGCIMGSLTSVISASCSIFPYYSFKAKPVAEAIQKERATAIYGTPTMFIDVLDLPDFDKYDFSSLETGLTAGAPMPEEVMKAIETKLAKNVLIGYGTTETSPVSTLTNPNDEFDLRTTTAGQPFQHVELKIVDGEGNMVPIGTTGEILTRGYLVMLGYWKEPEMTKEAITPDRWYKSGDLGTLDSKGYLRIVGRKKDMVIRGGENIYPREIEEFLFTNNKIVDVQVIGVPDKRLGEELCAWVRVKAGETLTKDEIKDFCKGKIAYFKIPRYILFVDEFPKTVTGKIQKFIMREQTIKLLQDKKLD